MRASASTGILSALAIALLPKCPACLAAYLTIATGIGVTSGDASNVQVVIVLLLVAPIVYMLASLTRRLTHH